MIITMWPYQLLLLLFIKALCSIVFFYHHYGANNECWAECSSYMTTCLAKTYNIAVAISLKFVGNRHGWKISLVWGKPTATNNPPKENPKRILIISSEANSGGQMANPARARLYPYSEPLMWKLCLGTNIDSQWVQNMKPYFQKGW